MTMYSFVKHHEYEQSELSENRAKRVYPITIALAHESCDAFTELMYSVEKYATKVRDMPFTMSPHPSVY
eukprot:CAMPEP_0201537912 /NCGR_PEP_ID=MMETSP0161_2-20130828/66145_1 /ASSEMBLY_ACC=CAM_ASM_000251 /TAXON_ID=180227 /ORGANISM="Neoparamoeba aestuarina, Strain SoJaBio B1-5/56/2" /LENGTH=68 /DNA_ID=CAMNT_0047944473 /DNA_START=101 /DNA_END=307 /DNA_ORIENTATION=-